MAITRFSNKTSSKIEEKKMETSVTAAPAPALGLTPEARIEAAHAILMQTPKDTPEHNEAWEELVDALFINAK